MDEAAGLDFGVVASFVADVVTSMIGEPPADTAAGPDATDPRLEPGTLFDSGMDADFCLNRLAKAEGGFNVVIVAADEVAAAAGVSAATRVAAAGVTAAAATGVAAACSIVAGAESDGRVDSDAVHVMNVADASAAGTGRSSCDAGSDFDAAPGCDAGSDAPMRRQAEQGM